MAKDSRRDFPEITAISVLRSKSQRLSNYLQREQPFNHFAGIVIRKTFSKASNLLLLQGKRRKILDQRPTQT